METIIAKDMCIVAYMYNDYILQKPKQPLVNACNLIYMAQMPFLYHMA
jgi:hypothetical protein